MKEPFNQRAFIVSNVCFQDLEESGSEGVGWVEIVSNVISQKLLCKLLLWRLKFYTLQEDSILRGCKITIMKKNLNIIIVCACMRACVCACVRV